MKKYLPEGKIFNSPENRYYLQSERTMAEAMAQGLILEGHAVLCDSEHNIIVELPFGKGIIPRSEGAIGIQEGKTKDIGDRYCSRKGRGHMQAVKASCTGRVH